MDRRNRQSTIAPITLLICMLVASIFLGTNSGDSQSISDADQTIEAAALVVEK